MSRSPSRRVLHLGPFQPVLENALVDEVKRVRAADAMQTIVVLCPTTLLCQHLKRALVEKLTRAKGFEHGHAGIRFMTLNDLAGTLATAAMAEEGKAALPAGAELVLWRRAVAALPAGGFF